MFASSIHIFHPQNAFKCVQKRLFSSSLSLSGRAIVYTAHGLPEESVSVLSCFDLPSPSSKTVNIRYLLAPINPSDINVIEGVYPTKPVPRSNLAVNGLGSPEQPCCVVGNEGLAEVSEVGKGVKNYKKGDWVVMIKPQAGTWSTGANVLEEDIMKIPDVPGEEKISSVQGAMMTVNPPTAYNMLRDFINLKPGDWVAQNGANSAVGQAVIQIAAHRGLRTINFVRQRPEFASLEEYLRSLGATHVLPLESLSDRSIREKVKGLTNGAPIRLALNCVSGPTTTILIKLLGSDAHLVSYGSMSRQPLSISTSAFIFKGLTAHGFMQNRWYREHGREERAQLMQELTKLMAARKIREPPYSIFTIPSQWKDEVATSRVRELLRQVTNREGMMGKKVLIKFE